MIFRARKYKTLFNQSMLLKLELQEREANRINRMVKTAGFRVLKTLDEFVWNSAIELPSGLTQEYMTDLHFLTPKENLIFMGTVGTGKTQAESYSQKPTIIHRI